MPPYDIASGQSSFSRHRDRSALLCVLISRIQPARTTDNWGYEPGQPFRCLKLYNNRHVAVHVLYYGPSVNLE